MKLSKSDLQLETIVSRINAGELDLQPDFQRGEIWDLKRRQRLIDTILRDWYVPAVHIVRDSNGNEEVLDGQQRLVAIRDFFADEIPVDGTIEPFDRDIAEMDGLKYSTLPESIRRGVNRFVIQTVTLSEHRPQEPNELFFRLNQSYNLTPPEKRNALYGEARDQVRDLVRQLTKIGFLARDKVGFANSRLAYDDVIARMCVALEVGTLRKHINNTVVEKFYRGPRFSDKTIGRGFAAGEVLFSQIQNASDRIKFNKGTLQTWLLYAAWAQVESGPLPPELLRIFETERLNARKGISGSVGELQEVVRIYDDRASYRVTDVTSVLARDLAIHLFSQAAFGTNGVNGSNELLENLRSSPVRLHQSMFFDFIDTTNWGDHLAGSDGSI